MEVFSRRVPASLPVSPEPSLPVMAPEQVQFLFRRRLSEICARFEDWQAPVQVSGIVGEVPMDRWRRREGTPLLDKKTGTSILLDIPPSLLEGEGLHAGERVRVLGLLRAQLHQGQVTPRFEVLSIVRDAEEDAAWQRDVIMQTLCELAPQRRVFPAQDGARMLLLGMGVGMERLRGVQQALGGFWTERNVMIRSIQQDDVAEVAAQAVRAVEQDIVFLLVAENCLPTLEAPSFMKALLQCPAYRVLAREKGAEEGTVTILPHLVDCFFSNPTEAAGHVRQQSGMIRQRLDEERAQQEELTALRASLAALTERPAETGRRPFLLPLLAGLLAGGGVMLLVLGILDFL